MRIVTHWKSSWTEHGCKVRRRKSADLLGSGDRRIIEDIELSCPYAEQPLEVLEYREQIYATH